jgi:para-aminobenzoate synthetase component 1
MGHLGRLDDERSATARRNVFREPAVPVVEEVEPLLEPADALGRLAGLPYPLLLDSALGHPGLGRYSFVTADPFAHIRSRGPRTLVGGKPVRESTDPFRVLAEQLARFRADPLPGLPPFQGGAAGLFGYDLCHHLERLPRPRWDEFAVPDLAVGLYDWVLAYDHSRGQAWLISTGFPETDARRRRDRAERRLRQVLSWLQRGVRASRQPAERQGEPVSPRLQYPVPGLPGLTSSFDRATYLETARRAIEYVHAGDCFQVNVAQRLLFPATQPPLELYLRLRQRNAATFAGYFDLGDFVIASASPERFLRVGGGRERPDEVETRPIKGTRPRGATPAEDEKRARELLASAKDRAENVMIVDLLRNDLGRVCRYGSIHVAALCRLESYRFVHHLVSEVRGRLRPGLGPVDLLRAAFPGGSVTGAPKVRAMEIIADLEPCARGAYCGSLGYVGFDGTMDTNILIRTFTVGRGWVQFPVGGGIVADSDPEREYEETWHKAEGMLRALR